MVLFLDRKSGSVLSWGQFRVADSRGLSGVSGHEEPFLVWLMAEASLPYHGVKAGMCVCVCVCVCVCRGRAFGPAASVTMAVGDVSTWRLLVGDPIVSWLGSDATGAGVYTHARCRFMQVLHGFSPLH